MTTGHIEHVVLIPPLFTEALAPLIGPEPILLLQGQELKLILLPEAPGAVTQEPIVRQHRCAQQEAPLEGAVPPDPQEDGATNKLHIT